MGSQTRYSSVDTNSGYSGASNMKRFMVIASVAAVAVAAPEADADPATSPDADAFYGQYQWPGYGVVGPYGAVSSTCYGCRPYGYYYGKRSAEAEPEPHVGYGVAVHAYGRGISHVQPTTFGLSYPGVYYGKRSAEPHGVAVHPYGHATSYVGRTIYGYPRYGKRSAEPHGTGVAFHPGYATSFNGPTIYGYPRYGKRSAQPQFPALAGLNLPSTPIISGGGGYGKRSAGPHGTGVAFHPGYATSFNGPTTYGLPHYGKRDAEAAPEAEASPDAEADADAFYGYYGYAPVAYGGYGYGWPGATPPSLAFTD